MRCPILVVAELPMLCGHRLLNVYARLLRLVLIVEHVHDWEFHDGLHWVYVPQLGLVQQ
jgi:hypothetical protein